MRSLIEKIQRSIDEASKKMKWGFDTTEFDSPADFQKIVDEFGLKLKVFTGTAPLGKYYRYNWDAPGIQITTYYNPITGRSHIPDDKEIRMGMAGYIGLTGEADLVKKAVAMIRKLADAGEESPNNRDFI